MEGGVTFWASVGGNIPAYTGFLEDAITRPTLDRYVPPLTRYMTCSYFVVWSVMCVGMARRRSLRLLFFFIDRSTARLVVMCFLCAVRASEREKICIAMLSIRGT